MKLTRINVPERPDLKKSHNFKLGDRVRWTLPNGTVHKGTVASLPDGPVVQIGPHTIGNEMGIDLDDFDGRAVVDVESVEKI